MPVHIWLPLTGLIVGLFVLFREELHSFLVAQFKVATKQTVLPQNDVEGAPVFCNAVEADVTVEQVAEIEGSELFTQSKPVKPGRSESTRSDRMEGTALFMQSVRVPAGWEEGEFGSGSTILVDEGQVFADELARQLKEKLDQPKLGRKNGKSGSADDAGA